MVDQEQFNNYDLLHIINLADREKQLEELKNMIKNNKMLTQLFPDAKNLVFGSGNKKANVMFIGEAPGKNEDESGEPFVGSSGKILNELLDKISFKRQDVYITNIVKYRPLNNRDPSLQEKMIFLPYLICQILIIKPKLLVTLGRHSFSSLVPDKLMKDFRGIILQIDLVKLNIKSLDLSSFNTVFNLLPIYHPAATIYNQTLKKDLLVDFLKIPNLISL